MSYLTVYNPEKVDVRTGYKGHDYDIKAGESKSFPEDVALWFVEMYPFLSLTAEAKSAKVESEDVVEKVKKVSKK